MLKKFTDFANEKKQETNKEEVVSAKTKVKDPKVKEPKDTIQKVKENETPKVESIQPKVDMFNFNGKIVSMGSSIKPSVSIVMLENKNVSKDKLHYIISKPTKETLVVLKYNENAEIKLTEFMNSLLNFYKTNDKIKKEFEKINIDGTEQFSIIKDIPDISFNNKKIIDILNENIIKLLK